MAHALVLTALCGSLCSSRRSATKFAASATTTLTLLMANSDCNPSNAARTACLARLAPSREVSRG